MSSVPAINEADNSFIIVSAACVMFMTPACGFFYSGALEFKNAISTIVLSLICLVVISLQFYVWGFSLTFSAGGNRFAGNFNNVGLRNLLHGQIHPAAPTIPGTSYMFYQNMFATVTPALAFGGIAERVRPLPFALFLLAWSTLVYDFVAYWVWGINGWLADLGFQDFAGGVPVHTVAGTSALALAIVVGPRKNPHAAPHNMPLMVLGTVFFWFGWIFFNSGSALAANSRASMAAVNTHIAACAGALTWCLFDYRIHHRITSLGLCSGAIAGLVCITPGSGFTTPYYSIIYGILGALGANLACFLKVKLKYDDTLDVFPIHAISGMIGCILNGFFSSTGVIELGGTTTQIGGWINQYWKLLGIQIAGILSGFLWTFVMTLILAYGFKYIPYLDLRATSSEEAMGGDISLSGEIAYTFLSTAVDEDEEEGEDVTPGASNEEVDYEKSEDV